MKLVSFRHQKSDPQPGVLVNDTLVYPVSGLGLEFPDVPSVLARGNEALMKIQEFIEWAPRERIYNLSDVRLTAPISKPPKFIFVGLNYRDHALETKAEIPKVPTIFSKYSNTVIGPGEPIVLPKNSTKPDYEAEFAFVIGKGGRHMAASDWQEHVGGYTIVNDVSARDFQMATSQWMMGKTFDTFAPMGPYVVTPEEVPDPHALDISLRIGDELLQQSNTSELIFKIPELVAFLSSVFTLEPGDVVSTGTPAGVGFARKPPRFLKPGDQVVIHVDRIGELRNPVVAEA
jgi:2-keto-4-pentenoate hydratase/2-oxohepta-3-ene-1,7-dioic acid hydratase in catechol pathway